MTRQRLRKRIIFRPDGMHVSKWQTGLSAAITMTVVLLIVAAFWARSEYSSALAFIKSRADELERAADNPAVQILGKAGEIKPGTEIESVTAHLRAAGYREDPAGERGSFYVDRSAQTAVIVPRYPEYPELKIKFQKQTIVSLRNTRTGESYKTAAIEPAALGSYLPSTDFEIGAIVHEPISFDKDLKDTIFWDALREVEDHDFMTESNGISWTGLGRAGFQFVNCLYTKVFGGKCVQTGGSTFSQQLVKNLFLTSDRTLSRKYREFWLTVALEKYLASKERIAELYVNDIVLSDAILDSSAKRKVMGFAALSRYLFGRSLRDLDAAEAVTLACFAQSPNGYLKRDEDGTFLMAEKLLTRRNLFLAAVGRRFPEKYPSEVIAQAQAKDINFVLDWKRDPLDKAAATYAAFSEKEAESLFKEKREVFKTHEPVRFHTAGDPEMLMSVHQILREEMPQFARQFQEEPIYFNGLKYSGSVVIYNPKLGKYISVNSLDFNDGELHLSRHAFDSTGQIMSLVKPFITGYGVEKHKVRLSDQIDPNTCSSPDGWRPPERHREVRPLGLQLLSSNNLAPLCVLRKIGLSEYNAWWERLSGKAGTADYRVANGLTAEANLSAVEFARLFGIFDQGKLRTARTISSYNIGEVSETTATVGDFAALRPEVARSIADQLRGGVDEDAPGGGLGTAHTVLKEAKLAGKNLRIFGKTGSGKTDMWIAVGTEQVVIVVRLTVQMPAGQDINSNDIVAADTAAPVAVKVLQSAYRLHPEWFKRQ